MRIRIIKPYKKFTKGQILMVDKAHGKLLLEAGVAVISKDIVETDIRTK